MVAGYNILPSPSHMQHTLILKRVIHYSMSSKSKILYLDQVQVCMSLLECRSLIKSLWVQFLLIWSYVNQRDKLSAPSMPNIEWLVQQRLNAINALVQKGENGHNTRFTEILKSGQSLEVLWLEFIFTPTKKWFSCFMAPASGILPLLLELSFLFYKTYHCFQLHDFLSLLPTCRSFRIQSLFSLLLSLIL